MAGGFKQALFGAAILFAAIATPSGHAHASSLMTACKVDVASLCNGVKEGRGRISACLFAHGNKISGACKPELTKVTRSGTFKRMVPAGLNSLKGTARDSKFREICAKDIRSHCAGVGPTDRLLACLYAWSGRIGKPCHAEAKAILSGRR